MTKLLDWIVARGWLDRWRGTESWIGRIVLRADVRAVKHLAEVLRELKEGKRSAPEDRG